MKQFSVFLLFILEICVCCGAVTVEQKLDVLVLKNKWVQLELNAQNFSLKQLTDLRDGNQYVTEPGGSLFTVTGYIENQKPPIWYVAPVGIRLTADKFQEYKFEKRKDGWILEYKNAPLGNGTVSVKVTITLPEDSSLFQWSISVDNSSDTPLQQVVFPSFSGLGSARLNSENTDYIAAPIYSGAKLARPRVNHTTGPGLAEYPGSGMSIQLLTYCDGQGGSLYFASHDADNYRKTFSVAPSVSKKSFREEIIHYADAPYNPGKWNLAYSVYWGPVQGDWYDTAKIYRKWAIQQPRWRKSLADRDDIPAWFRKLPVWFQGNVWGGDAKKMDAFADKMIEVRKALGYEMGFHWYVWGRYLTFDYNYPDYFPARPGFSEAVKKVQKAGIRVMPYMNIHLCETTLPLWKEKHLEMAAKRNSMGQLRRSYGVGSSVGKVTDTSAPVDVFRGEQNNRDMVPMCPAEKVWQDIMVDAASILVNQYGVDLIYYDETYVFPGLCFAKNHHHKWFGGTYHADAISEIHRRTHQVCPEGVITTGENLGESYIDVCSALIDGHSDMKFNSLPIFQTVFADRTTEIGIFVYRPEYSSPDIFASKLAFNLIRGRQLGWFNSDQRAFNLAKPEYARQLEILKKYCGARIAALPYLYEGEMLRAPDPSAMTTVKRTWVIWGRFDKVDYQIPVVLSGMYQAPDQSLGLILANVTNKKQEVKIPWNEKDWGMKLGTKIHRSIYVNGKWNSNTIEKLSNEMKIAVPAYAPVVIKISKL